MLVNLYSAKTPIAVISLPLLIALLALPIFFADSEPAFYFWDWQNRLDAQVKIFPLLNYALTVGILSLNAHQLSNVYNSQSFYPKATFLPGLIYVLGLFSIGMFEFSPTLISHLFVIVALRQFLKLRRQEGAKVIMFWGAVFVGMSIIFSFFSALLLFLPIIALITFRPFVWREWLMVVLGVAIPIFYYVSILYMLRGDFNFNIADPAVPKDINLDLVSASNLGVFGLILLGSLFQYIKVMRGQVNRFKKQSQIIFHFLWMSAAIWAAGYFQFEHLYLTFLIPVSFLVATPFLYAKNSAVPNGIVIIWLIISVANVVLVR